MTKRTRPPFRADHVGSFLRPAPLKDARAKMEKGQISAAELKAVEDQEIKKLIAKQEEIGLRLATDGEFRRSFWHFDFMGLMGGCELYDPGHGLAFQGAQTKAVSLRVKGKLDFPDNHPMIEHFKFLKANTKVVPKMTIPSPAVLHYRGGRKAISMDVYPKMDDFFADLGKAYGKAIKAFYNAGCRYLQLDDTVWAYLCSEDEMRKARERGDDTSNLQAIYRDVINAALKEKPADMTITTHVCRGNFRSTFVSSGGYEPVAKTLLEEVDYDGYFLEYDSDRAGGFEPLRFLPKGDKIVVVGVVTSKTGQLEKRDDVKRRLEEASKFVPFEQMALSPQCGFASTEEGNVLAEEEQWAKMKMVVDLAREIWGEA